MSFCFVLAVISIEAPFGDSYNIYTIPAPEDVDQLDAFQQGSSAASSGMQLLRWKWREQHNHARQIILTAECACLYKWLSCGKWKSSTDMFEILLRKRTAAARIGIHRHTQARDRAGPSCCGGLTSLLTSPRRSPRMIRHGRVLAKDQQQDRQGAVTNQASSCSG